MTTWPVPPLADGPTEDPHPLGRALFAMRWLLVPIYLGLLVALLLLAAKFVQKLVVTVRTILSLSSTETMLAILQLVDISLVANLVLIVMFSGWENVIGPGLTDRPTELTNVGFGALKQTLIASIAAIASIQILETFMHVGADTAVEAMWQLAILIGVGVTGVLLGLMDRLSGHR